MPRALLLFSIALLAAAIGVRADPTTPLPPAEQRSLDAFSADHKNCIVWSDGCVTCRRLQETTYACSTPGIACQPAALACQDRPDEKPGEASKPAPPMTAPKGAH